MVKENECAPTAGLSSATVTSKAARSSDSAKGQLLTAAGTLKLSLFHFSFPPFNSTERQLFHSLFARHPDSSLLQSASMLHRKNTLISRRLWNHILSLTLSYTSLLSNSEIQLWTLCSRETHPFLYTPNRLKFTAPQWTLDGRHAKDSHNNFHSKTTLLLIAGEWKELPKVTFITVTAGSQHCTSCIYIQDFWGYPCYLTTHNESPTHRNLCLAKTKDDEISHPEGSSRNSRD